MSFPPFPLLHILFLSLLLLPAPAPAQYRSPPQAHDRSEVLKMNPHSKKMFQDRPTTSQLWAPPEPVALGGPARWQWLKKSESRVRAFVLGSIGALEAGRLEAGDFVPVTPPDLGAALGLATVYEPHQAGWFVAGGRRLHVKGTDPSEGYATHSYESLARVAWAVGVTSRTQASSRLLWEAGWDAPLEWRAFVERAVDGAPVTGAWIVAGQALLPEARMQALKRAPVDGVALNDVSRKSNPTRSLFLPVEREAAWVLFVTLVVDPDAAALPAVGTLLDRFFPESERRTKGRLLMRTHAAVFREPVPEIEPGLPFQEIWYRTAPGREGFPQVRSVRELLEGSRVETAHASVYSIDRLEEFDLSREPLLVDLREMNPDILFEQHWASSNTLLGEAIYERPRLLLRREVAERILRIDARLREQGLRLKLFDGYRPLSVTQRLWKQRPDNRYLAMPTVGSKHNRGAAVDLTLTDLEGNELQMPSPYLAFDETAHRDWPGMPETARQNLRTLTRAMAGEGFTTLRTEWWHYNAPNWQDYPVLDIPLWPDEEQPPATADGKPEAATPTEIRIDQTLLELPGEEQNPNAEPDPQTRREETAPRASLRPNAPPPALPGQTERVSLASLSPATPRPAAPRPEPSPIPRPAAQAAAAAPMPAPAGGFSPLLAALLLGGAALMGTLVFYLLR